MKYCLLLIPFLLLSLVSCTPEPSPIEFGRDACDYCKMSIVDQRFGAELLTKKGKVYKFDAIECMINSLYEDKKFEENEVYALLTIDFGDPGNLVGAKECIYLHSQQLPSPMGMFLSAYHEQAKASEILGQKGGDLLNWQQMKDLVLNTEQ